LSRPSGPLPNSAASFAPRAATIVEYGMNALTKILLLALAGALGTLSRYSLAGVVQKAAGAGFPWGTMAANMAGCFLFGIVWSLFEGKIISSEARIIVLVGFMGAFTTFSSFVFESGELLRNGQVTYAALNILSQNIVGLAVFFGGLMLGKYITF